MPRPKKVNTHLKKLAESRARATATIERLNDNLENLRPKIEEAKEALLHLEELKFNIEHRLNLYHNEIRATDKTIREQFPGVEPTEIPTTYGFRSEYGRRGALRETIREVLREAGDEGITLKNLGLKVTEKLGLVHHTHADFRTWVKKQLGVSSLCAQIRKKASYQQGCIWKAPPLGLTQKAELMERPHGP